MTDRECVQFLRWALPRLRMRWPGFRKVRRQVCRRIARRLRVLGLYESLPPGATGWLPWFEHEAIYRRTGFRLVDLRGVRPGD